MVWRRRMNYLGHVVLILMCTELYILRTEGSLNRLNRKYKGKTDLCKAFCEDLIQKTYKRSNRVRREVCPSSGFLSLTMALSRCLEKSLGQQKIGKDCKHWNFASIKKWKRKRSSLNYCFQWQIVKKNHFKKTRKKNSRIQIVTVSAIQPALHTIRISEKCHGNFFLENPATFNFKCLPSDPHIFVSKAVKSENGSETAYAVNEWRKSKD